MLALGSFWLGREGGIRRYDPATDEWNFIPYDEQCPGYGTINLVAEPPYVWARRRSTGSICRLDTRDGTWRGFQHWTVIEHTGPGFPMYPAEDVIYVASTGSPDWEGVSIIDRESGEWMKLLETKPASCMYVDDEFLWLGVPQGVLRIDRISEEYRYYQPFEHGGGAFVKDVLPVPGGLAFATIGSRTGILGDRLRINKNSIQVYIKSSDKWYTYDKSQRERIVEDLQSGKIVVTNIRTNPGLLVFRDGEWDLLTTEDGLCNNEIIDLEKDDRYLYISSGRGISVLELNTLKPVPINQHMFNMLKHLRRTVAGEDYLWVFNYKELYKVDKRLLFSSPR